MYSISYLLQLIGPVRIYICDIKFFGCTMCLDSGIVSALKVNLFSNKIFSLNSVLQIVRFMILFRFFNNLGILLHFFIVYGGAARRASISNLGIENVGSAGQAGCTYRALE